MNYHLSAMHELEQAERLAGFPNRGPLERLKVKPERRIPRWAKVALIFGIGCALIARFI